MTTQVNPGLGLAENLFHDLVWKSLVDAGIAALFAAVPWLNIWPLSIIVKYILNLFSEKIFVALRLSLDLSVIAFLNQEHKEAFEASATKLQILAHSYGIDSPQFMEEKQRAKDALAKFVAYNK